MNDSTRLRVAHDRPPVGFVVLSGRPGDLGIVCKHQAVPMPDRDHRSHGTESGAPRPLPRAVWHALGDTAVEP